MKILFLCVANSARSQIAEGLAGKIFPEADIQSAGSNPGKLNQYAIAVMKEVGIDISNHHSKSLDHLSPKFIVGIDFIITLCAEEVCPRMVAPNAKKVHWPLPDPASKEALSEEEMLARFRAAREAIGARLEEWKSLLPASNFL